MKKNDFTYLKLSKEILQALKDLTLTKPTPIQASSNTRNLSSSHWTYRRAGRQGKAVSIATAYKAPLIASIEQLTGIKTNWQNRTLPQIHKITHRMSDKKS